MQSKSSLLPRFAINRPVTTIVTILAALVVGLIAFKDIPVDLMPSGFEGLTSELGCPIAMPHRAKLKNK